LDVVPPIEDTTISAVAGDAVGPVYYFVARPRRIASATEPKITAKVAS
jgi:hypothetical protein